MGWIKYAFFFVVSKITFSTRINFFYDFLGKKNFFNPVKIVDSYFNII